MQDYNTKPVIDFNEGVNRFSGHRELYEKYLRKFAEKNDFNDFFLAMQEKRYEDAFRFAHTIKGVVGNLSFSRLYAYVYDIVEQLRNLSDIPGAEAAIPTLKEQYELLTAELAKVL